MGAGDTLLVLLNVPPADVIGSVYSTRRFTGDGAPLAAWAARDFGNIWRIMVDAQGRILRPTKRWQPDRALRAIEWKSKGCVRQISRGGYLRGLAALHLQELFVGTPNEIKLNR
jgi:hypothetical protein